MMCVTGAVEHDLWPVGLPVGNEPQAHLCLACGQIAFRYGPALNLVSRAVPQPPLAWSRQVTGIERTPEQQVEILNLATQLLVLHMNRKMVLA